MARVVKPRKQKTSPATPLQAMLEEYIESLAVKGFSDDTRNVRRELLSLFERWAAERGLVEPVEITRPVLERYQRYLFYYRKKDGRPLTFSSQHSRLSPLRQWFKWMTRQNYLLHNPASELELPRLPKPLPRVLTASEAETILQQPNVADSVGLRDRAMLEMFYSTGMRRTELLRLRLYDVDREAGIVTIREGKGKKDRVIPIGERAVAWLDKYLYEARPRLAVEPDDMTVFLTVQGEPFSPNTLSLIIREHVEGAKIGKRGACHLFRHTMATLMHEGGADIRFIQEILGHARLDTTQIYTHVSIRMLKQIHSATHPAASLKRSSGDPADAAQNAVLAQRQIWPGTPAPTAEELFAALDAESAEEDQD
ncbi:MAG: site-specific tyrosine recombinase XerC [Acidobacteriaceae bacterium]